MSDSVKKANRFLKNSSKKEVCKILDEIILSERQEKIFQMFYIKKNCAGFIADSLYVSDDTVYKELAVIRSKMLSVI